MIAPGKQFRWMALGVLAVALLVRAPQISRRSLWTDELTTLNVIRAPWGDIAAERMARGHSPLYFWGLKAWRSIAGESPAALRCPSLAFNLAAILLLMVFVRDCAGGRAALWAGLLFAVHQRSLWMALEARPYSAMVFCVVLAHAALARCMRSGAKPWAALYALASILAALTHSSAAPVLLFHVLLVPWVARSPVFKGRRAPIIAALSATFLAVLAVFLFLASQRVSADSAGKLNEPSLDVKFMLDSFAQLFMGEYKYIGGSSLKYIGVAIGAWALWRVAGSKPAAPTKDPVGFATAILWCLSSLLVLNLMVALGRIGHSFRYFTPAMPGAMALLALAAVAPRAGRLHKAVGSLCLLVVLAVAVGFSISPGDGLRQAVRVLVDNAQPNEKVFAVMSSQSARIVFDYYGPVPCEVVLVDRSIRDSQALQSLLTDETNGLPGFWLVLYKAKKSPFLDIARESESAYKESRKFQFKEVRAFHFTQTRGRPME